MFQTIIVLLLVFASVAITSEGLKDKASLLSNKTDLHPSLSPTRRNDKEEESSMKEVDEKSILKREKNMTDFSIQGNKEHRINGNIDREFPVNRENVSSSNKESLVEEVSASEDWEKYSTRQEDFFSNIESGEEFNDRKDKFKVTEKRIKRNVEEPTNITRDLSETLSSSKDGLGKCQGDIEQCISNSSLDYVAVPKEMTYKYDAKLSKPSILWPFGNITGYPTVPYNILIKDPAIVQLIEECISEWESVTCVDFISITDEQAKGLVPADFLNIRENPVRCIFRFGKLAGRAQSMFLHPSCHTKGEILRGLGMALGMQYQFLRLDRDSHLNIHMENANDQFPKFERGKFQFPNTFFDYSSAMQPHSLWLSKNGKLTFTTKDIKYQGLLGRPSGGISHRDKYALNKLYGCLGRWRSRCGLPNDPCLSEGYLGQSCHCVCRRGTFGSMCTSIEWRDYYGPFIPPCSKNINQETTIEAPSDENGLIPYDTWCTWHISAPEGQVINLKFDTFNLEKSGRTCEKAFLEIRQKNETFGNVYCGDDLSQKSQITSLSNELKLYLDVRNNNSKGFRAEVRFLASPTTIRSLEGTTEKSLNSSLVGSTENHLIKSSVGSTETNLNKSSVGSTAEPLIKSFATPSPLSGSAFSILVSMSLSLSGMLSRIV